MAVAVVRQDIRCRIHLPRHRRSNTVRSAMTRRTVMHHTHRGRRCESAASRDSKHVMHADILPLRKVIRSVHGCRRAENRLAHYVRSPFSVLRSPLSTFHFQRLPPHQAEQQHQTKCGDRKPSMQEASSTPQGVVTETGESRTRPKGANGLSTNATEGSERALYERDRRERTDYQWRTENRLAHYVRFSFSGESPFAPCGRVRISPFFFAQLSFSVQVRLKTGRSGVDSRSVQK